MDLQLAEHIFNSLYSDVNGYTISAQARKNLSHFDKSYTYGEIAFESFVRILKDLKPQKGDIFYDLGSGTGKAVILASLLGDFSSCIGIEYLEELVKCARSIVSRYEKEYQINKSQSIKFVQADFLDYNFSDADIVFMHSTCFLDEMLIQLQRKMFNLKEGAKVVAVTKTLEAPYFKLLKSNQYNMGWGTGTVSIYEKVEI